MKFSEYVASKAITLCFLGIGALLAVIALGYGGAETSFLLGAGALFLAIVFAWLFCGFWLVGKRLKRLKRLMEGLKDRYLLGELLPAPQDPIEKKYFSIMKSVSRSAVGAAEEAIREKNEYCDYVASWIHELKTPLTACSLILSNGGDAVKLKRELKRADNLTESILYYARMRTIEKDNVIHEASASHVLNAAVKSQMELLTAAGISVEITGDFTVYTDAKALSFIVKQLLINAAKYCPGCRIEITADHGRITVRDNGIGIPPHELRRVTERGFTGSAGRRQGGSTGMGLYIVKNLCTQLSIRLAIDSEEGKYTSISLTFENLTEP